MVDWILRNSSVVWTTVEPSATTRLTDHHVLVVRIANRTNRSITLQRHLTGLTGRKLHRRILTLFRYELSSYASRSNKLCATTNLQLNVVDILSERNRAKRKRVTRLDVSLRASADNLTNGQSLRSKNVTLLSVAVHDKSDTS
jgi:hypothetical protein